MGQILHGSATTTEAVRRAIQRSQESLRALAKRYGVNPKTIAKWKSRTSVSDRPTGPMRCSVSTSRQLFRLLRRRKQALVCRRVHRPKCAIVAIVLGMVSLLHLFRNASCLLSRARILVNV